MLVDAEKDLLLKNAVFILLSIAGEEKAMNMFGGGLSFSNLDVFCTINVVEVDIRKLIHEVNSTFENRVKEAAEEVVRTKLADLIDSLEQIDCLWTRLSFLEIEYEKLQLEIKQSNYRLVDVADKYYELSLHFDEMTEMLQDDSY